MSKSSDIAISLYLRGRRGIDKDDCIGCDEYLDILADEIEEDDSEDF